MTAAGRFQRSPAGPALPGPLKEPFRLSRMNSFKNLLALLGTADLRQHKLYIQTHDFPDPDAVAAAFGLQRLLENYGYRPEIVYAGEIQREALLDMIRQLGIRLGNAASCKIAPEDPIIIVDGCKGSNNVTELPGDEIAVIDHHEVAVPKNVAFSDIRPAYGACSSIIYEYYLAAGIEVPGAVATALLLGLNIDTALLMRRVSEPDLEAHYRLHRRADNRLVNELLRNNAEVKDLDFFKTALSGIIIEGDYAFCYFPDGCRQNLMGIMCDFFLALKEVNFAVVCARNGNRVNVSVRSEKKEWNASDVVRRALAGSGSGGGHPDMAAGIIPDAANFQEDSFREKTAAILRSPAA